MDATWLTWIEAAFLGLLQGLTEFLPVSSSAHLRIAGALLPSGVDPGAAFTAVTQIGTEAAVLIYFRADIWRIATAWLGSLIRRPAALSPDARMGWLVILGTLPIAVLGLSFKHAIEGSLRDLHLTATMLIVFGLLLGLADRLGTKRLTLEQLSWRNGLILGFAQAMALVPGVSRSGGTISAGLMLGFTREAAARYSFLLAIPAVLASGVFELADSWGQFGAFGPGPTLLATVIAFVSGYGVIVAFLRIIATRSYMPFVVYRLVAGLAVFALLAMNVIPAR
ncbi:MULTISPECIES: undecaprenyl-diphosphate phosphatase [Sphingomonas]|uniref:Undecaprenyl-diphosphatase n=1 Tax=Sphingomonas kyungheensis TaxID=1069987 RepID=A0ABU8H6U9_9SPHN|nr:MULTISPECIES: undecaprenyl-diphosphate phosphatase [unclassified Sphingomonas]EZP54339.1 Undecaprenyl-diphosphatase [Sphingomonas sp. RIT328]